MGFENGGKADAASRPRTTATRDVRRRRHLIALINVWALTIINIPHLDPVRRTPIVMSPIEKNGSQVADWRFSNLRHVSHG